MSAKRPQMAGQRFLIPHLLVVAMFASVSTQAQVDITGSGLRIGVPATSIKGLRDRNLVRQRFDFSCGAAALATILRFGYGDDVTEPEILTELFGLLPDDEQAATRETGFSLLNLQQVAQARGYRAAGFRLAPEQIPMLGGPVIVYIEPRGYRHFAVLRGVRGDRVYLADPSRGNVRMPMYRFLADWMQDDGTGIIFVVEPETGLDGSAPLGIDGAGLPPPEIMSAREMLAVGNVLMRPSGPPRQ